MKTLLAALHVTTLISTWAAGALGAATVWAVGGPLAMLGQMYTGNTEPIEPHLAYPWAVTVVAGLLPAPLLLRRWWLAASIASIPFALAPWWQLWRLYGAAGG